jgi:hypothetical protein
MPDTITESSFDVLAKAVDDAAAGIAELDETSRKAAEELRAAIEAVHRAGLVTIVRRLRGDEAGKAVLYELVDDPLIRMLFSLHGIIRTDTPAGVGAAGEHTGKETSSGQCGCGDQAGGGCGCGHSHGVQQAGPTLIPLAAIGHRSALDLWPEGAA